MEPLARPRDRRPLERVAIDFSWLIKLRWAAFAGQAATILLVAFWLRIELPLVALCVILVFEALSNVVLRGWFRGLAVDKAHRDDSSRFVSRVLGSVLLLDVVLLTLLLLLTGGTRNPFSVFYLVNIVLSAVVLGPRWTALVTAVALIGYACVYLGAVPLPGISELGEGTWARRVLDRGVLVAFVTATSVIAFFLTRISSELSALERRLAAAERDKARSERMEALGTMAAGAAHELASPLSTIAVVAKDLERLLGDQSREEAEDARLIRREVDRCRGILDQMAIDAGQMTGAELVATRVDALVASAIRDLKREADVVVGYADATEQMSLLVPKRALALALRQVVKNALDASPTGRKVDVDVSVERSDLWIEVYDRGAGMSPDTIARATDPFFTTKEPGQGMGLGLFLAQTVIERLDGRIAFESKEGEGTTVRVELPLARVAPTAATEARA
jgi:two-component system sensor histidine kinase RegB